MRPSDSRTGRSRTGQNRGMPLRSRRALAPEVDAALGPAPSSLAQPEVVLLRFRRHGRRLVAPVTALVIVAAVAGYWVGALQNWWLNLLAAAGAIAAGLLLGLIPVLRWLTRRTTVTTRRVIVRRGFFVRQRSEIPLARVREVRVRRGPIQRLWGAGDIDLLVGAEAHRLEDVPGAAAVTEALQDLMERNYANELRTQVQRATLGLQPLAPGVDPRSGLR